MAESPNLTFTTDTQYHASNHPYSVRNGPYPRWEHNLGQTPVFYSMSLRCKVAENGWSPGEEFQVDYNGSYGRGEYSVWADSTYVGFIFKSGTTNNPFTVGKKEESSNNPANVTANSFLPDPTKWKIVFRAAASFGGGGSNTAGLPRTQWPVRAVDGINTLNSFDFSVTGNQWKYSPQKRYNFVYPNSWVFNAVRGLNPSSAANFAFFTRWRFCKILSWR